MRSHSYAKRCTVVGKWMAGVLKEWNDWVKEKGEDWTRDTEQGRQEVESLAKA